MSTAAALKCQQCREARNTVGDTIESVSDIGCFDGESTEFEMECPRGEICRVEMSVDWLPRGDHRYRVER